MLKQDYFQSISEAINQRETLKGLVVAIRTDNNLNQNEKDELLEITQQYLKDAEANAGITDEPYCPELDFSEFIESLTSWRDLDGYDLPYPRFLEEVVLKQCFPMPEQDIQHKLLTCCMLIYTPAIPFGKGLSSLKLPIIFNTGDSHSGKTSLSQLWGTQYPKKYFMKFGSTDTGFKMTETIHNNLFVALKYGDPLMRAGLALVDNVYLLDRPEVVTLQKRLGAQFNGLMQTTRDACKYTSNLGTFYSYCLRILTSVDSMAGSYTLKELTNRTMQFIFKRNNPYPPKLNASKILWDGIDQQFINLWSKENIYNLFLPNVKLVIELEAPENIDKAQWSIIQLPLAVGLSFGLFVNLDEGLEYCFEYWNVIERLSKGNVDTLTAYCYKYFSEIADDELNKHITRYRSPNSPFRNMNDKEIISRFELVITNIANQLHLWEESIPAMNAKTRDRIKSIAREFGYSSKINNQKQEVLVKETTLNKDD